ASGLGKDKGLPIVLEAGKKPLDEWMLNAYETAIAHLNGYERIEKKAEPVLTDLKGAERDLFVKGKAIYARDGFCNTCHQSDGRGLQSSGFPPLAGTSWATGSEERLIKLVLKGLHGPIEVLGQKYPGQVPMTPFAGMLNDDEVAAVLTYVRNSFGNKASVISSEKVKVTRSAIKDKTGFYSPDELLKQHPLEQ
ncbi:MAG: cytochrome c, partial [Pedobacter sp.]